MSEFGNIAQRLRARREAEEAQQEAEKLDRDWETMDQIQSRILGVLIRDARMACGLSLEEGAQSLEVAPETLENWEYGKVVPSLPELELLSYNWGVPLSRFWSIQTIGEQMEERHVPAQDYAALRDRYIGVMVHIKRKEADMEREALAEHAGLSEEELAAYETGHPIPMPHLTRLASALGMRVEAFFEEASSRVGQHLEQEEAFAAFMALSPEVRSWVVKITSQPFIEMAMKLSQIEVDRLRRVGESILDITIG